MSALGESSVQVSVDHLSDTTVSATGSDDENSALNQNNTPPVSSMKYTIVQITCICIYTHKSIDTLYIQHFHLAVSMSLLNHVGLMYHL